MVFASITFLFLFLPLTLGLFFLSPRALKLPVLLVMSLLFYAWSTPEHLSLMLISIVGNYFSGLLLVRKSSLGWRKAVLTANITFNIGMLCYFKYFNFGAAVLNDLLGNIGSDARFIAEVALPVGISFYTFQAMSYVIDLYRGEVHVQRSLTRLALYVSLFPQLIAGPIVRYKDIEEQLDGRTPALETFVSGISRFIIGLGKKVILANGLGEVADKIFTSNIDGLSVGGAWLGVLCYFFQIYFDFSGYSDMAIGLGRMFGFEFMENFNYPYISKSITEFWRRWHISLSTWFRDYLYIPLGGSRRSSAITYRNLFIVFALCGLWHGAAWNFVLWGLFHGLLLVIERVGFGAILEKIPSPLRSLYVWLTVLFGWVLFRAESLELAGTFMARMLGAVPLAPIEISPANFLNNELYLIICMAFIGCTPWPSKMVARLRGRCLPALSLAIEAAFLGIIFSVVVLRLSAGVYNPFIYFRF